MAAALEIRPMKTQAEAAAFRSLNELWITELFALEEQDRLVLNDPFGTIIAQGGQVYIAAEGDTVLGTAALMYQAPGVYQLAKMTVASQARNRGIGRQLLNALLEQLTHWVRVVFSWAAAQSFRALFAFTRLSASGMFKRQSFLSCNTPALRSSWC